jgi:hypothetical protein
MSQFALQPVLHTCCKNEGFKMDHRLQACEVTRETNIGLWHTQHKFGETKINLGFHVVRVHPKTFNSYNHAEHSKKFCVIKTKKNALEYKVGLRMYMQKCHILFLYSKKARTQSPHILYILLDLG